MRKERRVACAPSGCQLANTAKSITLPYISADPIVYTRWAFLEFLNRVSVYVPVVYAIYDLHGGSDVMSRGSLNIDPFLQNLHDK